MTFQYIVMGIIVISLASIYAVALWAEKDNRRMEEQLKR